MTDTSSTANGSSTNGSISGRRVVITGAASGLGQAAARLFAERGARVALVDINADRLEEGRGQLAHPERHVSVPMDVSDPTSVREGFGKIAGEFGGLDVAYLAAGICDFENDGPLKKVEPDFWDRMIAVNLTGTFLTAQAAFEMMPEHGGGSIITVASITALIGQKRLYAYSASKGGILAFTRVLAIEGGKVGIRANCICPGTVQTGMTDAILEHSKPINVLDRAARPEEIAQTVLHLASPESSFVTGAAIPIDGGATTI